MLDLDLILPNGEGPKVDGAGKSLRGVADGKAIGDDSAGRDSANDS